MTACSVKKTEKAYDIQEDGYVKCICTESIDALVALIEQRTTEARQLGYKNGYEQGRFDVKMEEQ